MVCVLVHVGVKHEFLLSNGRALAGLEILLVHHIRAKVVNKFKEND